MMLPQIINYFQPAGWAPGDNSLPGTTQRWAIDRTWPIEEIILIVEGVVNAQLTNLVDGPLAAVSRINLSINDGVQPRSVVECSGVGALEYAMRAGLNLDRATLQTWTQSARLGTVAAAMAFRVCYRIPLVHPFITEPLRTRMLLDVNNHPQDPVLTVDFNPLASYASAGSLTSLGAEVVLVRKQMPDALNQSILKSGGYIPFDLVETPFNIAVAGEFRLPVPTPGQYESLLMRVYQGIAGPVQSRTPIDAVTTQNSESRWRLETGNRVLHDWRMKHLQCIGDYSGVANTAIQASSPNAAGPVAANTSWQPASSVMLDFLSNGVADVSELGGLLDCNSPVKLGLKMEVIGNAAAPAAGTHTVYLMGHRLFGDLSAWQAVK